MASRTGSARVFFEIVGQFQADRLLKDAEASAIVTRAIWLDALGGIAEAFEFAFDGIRDLVEENIESFVAYEEQLIQVRKFYQGSTEDVDYFAEASLRLGETFAFSGAEALKAAAQMAQMKTVLGSKEAVIAGTEMGLLFAEIGNMDTQLAMKRMTSLMQQTQFALGGLTQAQYDNLDQQTQAQLVMSNTIRVLDQLNTIENSSVATMEDMTFVLNQFSAQGNLAGESMATMASFAALLLEAGEETSRAGTGLRMMYSRLAVDGGDASQAIAEIVPHLEAQEISTMSLSQVIEEMIPYYTELSDIEKIRVTQAIAGNRHYVKLQKIIENHERFITLTGMAYSNAYPAIEEFENRQESMKFQIDKANALIENQRALVGDNLAEAYVKSLEPQYLFLRGLRHQTDEATTLNYEFDKMGVSLGVSVKSAIENIMLLGAVMEQLTLPANFVLGLANISISFRVFAAISKQTTQLAAFQTEAFGRRMYMIEQEKQMQLASLVNYEKAFTNSHRKIQNMNHQQYTSKLKSANAAKNRIALIQAENKQIIASHKLIKNIMTEEGQLASWAAMGKKQNNDMLIQQEQTLYNQRMQEYQLLKIIYQNRTEFEQGMSVYYKMGHGERAQAIKSNQALGNAIKNSTRNMANGIIVFKSLSQQERGAIQRRSNMIQQEITQLQLKLSVMRVRLETSRLSETEKQQELEAIARAEEEIINLGEELARKQQLIQADKTLNEGLKQQARNKSFIKSLNHQLRGTEENLLKTQRAAVGTATKLLGLYTMTASSAEDMEAALYGIVIAQGILAAKTRITTLAQKKYTASTIVAIGATNILAGILVAGVAFGLGKVAANMINVNSQFDDLSSSTETMTNNFNDLLSVTKDLSMKGDETILAGILDMSYNDLRRNSALANSAYQDIIAHEENMLRVRDTFKEGTSDYDLANIGYNTAMQTRKEIESIMTAHGGVGKFVNDYLTEEFRKIDTAGLQIGKSENFLMMEANESLFLSLEEIIDGKTIEDKARERGIDMWAFFVDGVQQGSAKTEGEADWLRTLYLEEQFNLLEEEGESLAATYQTVFDNMLSIVGESALETSGVVSGALSDMNEFVSAREELFFGTQSNFQGAIYKQVTQGGVESLLHRVEIIQHNHFNGMTLPEMISQVTEGVIVEMRGQGVPI